MIGGEIKMNRHFSIPFAVSEEKLLGTFEAEAKKKIQHNKAEINLDEKPKRKLKTDLSARSAKVFTSNRASQIIVFIGNYFDSFVRRPR